MLKSTRRLALLGSLAAGLSVTARRANAQPAPLKIGILTDLTGIVSDAEGEGAVHAARMAVEERAGTVAGRPIQVLAADHQHKPDVGSAIARRWFDEDKVDVIADVPNSAVALAVTALAQQRNKITLISGAGSTALTNTACSPTGFHWTSDTYAVAHGLAGGIVKQGGDSWFLILADYAFGQQLAKDVTAVVAKAGGKVLGRAAHPLGTSDYSSFLLQAQASGAKVIGICNAGSDTINTIKQANEFGLTKAGQKLAVMIMTIADVHSLGLDVAQGVTFVEPFYWNADAGTRAWSQAYFSKMKRMPSLYQIGTYEAVRHYLSAVAETNSTDSKVVAEKMRETPIESAFTHNGRIRVDGRVVRPMYLERIKSPGEAKEPWDYMTIERTIPGDDLVWPLSESECPLVRT